ncbi:MAG: MBL fold metallo-hydrolase [Flavobacteriales bacterium]|nr:MBL fold metallo-hydrolase [Flavobacteriales bacterium]
MAHTVRMLGTGNAFLPHGRLHSLAIVDDVHLIDAPPTVLFALRREGIDVASIRTVFITHVHGDHVFGFPFLLLERKYISDREGQQPLRVVTTPFGEERLRHLCQLAFPGSLDDSLDNVEWLHEDKGRTDEGWSWDRFRVHHEDAVEPFGYRFEHQDGANLVHSGDSGPCENLTRAMKQSALCLLEMGFPDWVPSTHHHKPKDVALAAAEISSPIGITHTFIDAPSAYPTLLEVEPMNHPPHVVHLKDGDLWNWSNGAWSHHRTNC